MSSAHRTDLGLEAGLDLLLPNMNAWAVESRDGGGDLERADRSGVDRDEEEDDEGETGGVVFDFRTEEARIVIFVTGDDPLAGGEDKIYLERRVSV